MMLSRLVVFVVCLLAAGCSESPTDPADSPSETSAEPESAEAPEPQLQSAPWDEAPVTPPAFVSEAAAAWALHVDWCNMIAPTSDDGHGQDWTVEFHGVFRTGQASFSISGYSTEIGLDIWPLDEPEVQKYFEPDVFEEHFVGGSTRRWLEGSRLIAIPGEECFYELSLREWNMVSLSSFFSSLQRIDTRPLSS